MLYASAAFMFLFLPTALGIYTLMPGRLRKYVLLMSGVLFYIFANLRTPLAIPVLAAVAALTYAGGKKVAKAGGKLTFGIIVAADIAAFIALRIIYEASGGAFVFPLGAAVYLLMSVSYLADIRRGDCEPGGIVDSMLYLTFFPVMAAGPLVKYKDFRKYIENISFNINSFAGGARLFAIGFIEVIAVSAVLTTAYKSIIEISGESVNAIFGLLAALLVYMSSFFAIAGWTDMGAGISLMFGIIIPRDCGFAPAAYSPSVYFGRIFRGLGGFFDDYLVSPAVSAVEKRSGKKLAAALGSALMVLAVTLWIKTTPAMLAAALTAAAVTVLFRISGAEDMLEKKKFLRPLGWMFTAVLMVFFWTAAASGSLNRPFGFFGNLSFTAADFKIYYATVALSGRKLIAVAAAALFVLVPLSYYGDRLADKLPKRALSAAEAVSMFLLLGAFVYAIMFFMPQYPAYASKAFVYLAF
jgi:D-alanyl-lipoteichoic acid acyltransferase DltB (MBOAT superfamily)